MTINVDVESKETYPVSFVLHLPVYRQQRRKEEDGRLGHFTHGHGKRKEVCGCERHTKKANQTQRPPPKCLTQPRSPMQTPFHALTCALRARAQ